MFGIKTKFKNFLSKKSQNLIEKDNFPQKPLGFFEKKWLNFLIKKQLDTESKYQNLSSPVPQKINKGVQNLYQNICAYNPNNLGNWSAGLKTHSLSTYLEQQTVKQMVDLLNGNEDQLEGYISSGSTEGNIFACWAGREYLKKEAKKQILLLTDLTHYSVLKAAKITSIKTKTIALNSEDWNMDLKDLEKTVRQLHLKGVSGFLLPITFGYTLTGTSDSYKKINQLITRLKQEINVDFFTWIDAAFSGLISPFTEKSFSPLSLENISLFTTDYHKYPALPYPSGVIIYKKPIRKLIENEEVSYINYGLDATVLGSRPGLSSILIWYLNQIWGKSNYEKQIQKSLLRKESLLKMIKTDLPDLKIINNKKSIQFSLIPKNKHEEQILSKKYNLDLHHVKLKFTRETKNLKICKVFFLNDNLNKKINEKS